MRLRRTLLVLLGLWVALGVALAPAMPMPGMAMDPSPAGAMAAIHGDSGHGEKGHSKGHHDPAAAQLEPTGHQHAPEPGHSGQAHQPNCVLCVVGAGTLALVVVVLWDSSRTRTVDLSQPPRLEPERFRHFRSRAPPAFV